MPSEPVWLTEDQVCRINERLVEQTGEPFLVLHPGLLSSGMARPKNRWSYGEEDIPTLAGVLLLGIGMNHPFQQGNKRTAITAASIFLKFNGYSFVAPDGDPLGALVERSIVGMIPEAVFLNTMRKCAITTSEWELLMPKRQP